MLVCDSKWEKLDMEKNELVFKGGQSCWNGPQRSLTVSLECGDKEVIHSVEETSKCVYAMRFSTPAICDIKHANALKLELEAGAGEGDDDF